ncbi:phosphatidylglycerophosphatase B [Brevibacillus reuszeri]|uniref:Phosphatidylglycerophosphatase B n=1 Tax=Brevibacillus reuszeri TaxID=54915 RepID=A0A0K9YRD4_9BACL|nr:phosphatase PAP2 family protein [Brevibacillus reuszeri]KNB71283.1 phospholipid phosphatase [Brevibacillus reuszeri]MED1857722.1 phosphatase PAP2 family protein [Brevibacillus reuszeri]GED66445.1 phosphatidylglycerophosphatase B [Brevibacillus reuszeri]
MRARKKETGLIAWAFLFAIFSAVMLIMYTRNAVSGMDEAAFAFVSAIRSDGFTSFFQFLTHFGGGMILAPLGVVLVIAFYIKGHREKAVLVILTLGVCEIANEAMKLIFARTRPDVFHLIDLPTSFSFPSGHAMVGSAFYLMLAYLLSRWGREKHWSRYVVPFTLLFIILIAGSRVYLGVHFFSDIVTGFALSMFWYFAVRIGFERWEGRREAFSDPLQQSP